MLSWSRMDDLAVQVVESAVAIQQIPAPTFDESARAAYVASQFATLGLTSVGRDERHNAYGLLPGVYRNLPGLMISAHTDTIFPRETNLATRAVENTIYGPGLGDNSIGVAGLLGLAQYLARERITPLCDLWFVATAGEEGLGDLCGMKAAFARLKPYIAAVINLEGLAFGHIYHAGIAVRRLHITASTGGGHSWLHFGRPSAVHGILELGSRILAIQPAQTPRTTYNIGMIEGGQAINALATGAGLWLDMRSEEPGALATLEAQVRAAIDAVATPELVFRAEVVGDRPAGHISPDHPLVQGALAALERLGVRGTLESGSTDGNVPLSEGCPTVTIGITRGGNAHRLDEYIELAPVAAGMRQLITLTLAAAYSAEGR
jgi:acetylornithine deacetylase/succinyl-diaminopimelate desuccinylase-like protein